MQTLGGDERIGMIQTKKQQLSSWMRYGLIISAFMLSAAIGAERVAAAIAPQDSAKPTKIYQVGGDVSAPKLIASAGDPIGPPLAKKDGVKFDGVCLVEFIVNESGVPQKIHIVRSIGRDYDVKVMEAAQQYRFSPAMRAGQPVAVSLHMEVRFKKA
jgi:TonB family protein